MIILRKNMKKQQLMPKRIMKKKSSSNLKDILEGILTWIFGIVAGLWILFYVGTFFYVLISDKIKKRIKNKKDK